MATEATTVDVEVLDDIVRRIREVADPERIIMFGSAARGQMDRNSDIDLLVVKSGANRLELVNRIQGNLHGAGAAVDVIVARPEDLDRYRENHYVVIGPALKEGKVIYDARKATTRRSG